MVREAKDLVSKGKIGKINFINVEYVQDWADGDKITKKKFKKNSFVEITKKCRGHFFSFK